VNSDSRSLYVVVRPCVCLSSVTFGHPTQPVEIFGNVSIRHLVPLTSTKKFTEVVPGEPIRREKEGELKAKGVAKYSDFGFVEGYISETV